MKKLSILILLTLFALTNGNLWAEPTTDEQLADISKAKDADVYSCPMHPEVRQDKEGKCPMCGMNLERVVEQEGGDHHGHQH